MERSDLNHRRAVAVQIARNVRWLFAAVPERFGRAALRATLLGWLLRWLFLAPDGNPHRAGEIVLADLRNFCTGTPMFSTDPLVMARRAGRRETFERLINYLNLDEAKVQKLMELDDGLG